jgi:hypothetical protein
MRVIIGHDARTPRATVVALATLRETSGIDGEVLYVDRMRAHGLYTRVEDTRRTGANAPHRRYDFASQADCSTEFANARFLTPILGTGFTLFTDSDVVFQRDVHEMISEIKESKPVYVVKHKPAPLPPDYRVDIGHPHKMDGQAQQPYSRKNWSSVMLFNCAHPANRRLSLWDVNNRPGRDLHNFYWLNDHEIGELAPEWNWLVGQQPKPAEIGIAHFTLGGPFIEGWKGAEHDEIWREARG